MKSICCDKRWSIVGKGWAIFPLFLSIFIIFWVVRAEISQKDMCSFSYLSESGSAHFRPLPGKCKIIILFSINCPFCMSYIAHLNRLTGILPDHQYGLFTTDRPFFQSSFYESWEGIRQDTRFETGILDISTAYTCFGDPPLPVTLIYDHDNKHIKSLRGEMDIRELLKWIPEDKQKHQRKGVAHE